MQRNGKKDSKLESELNALFNFNPPAARRRERGPPLLPPVESFYDMHVDSSMALKRIVKMPSLVYEISKYVDRVISDRDARGETLPPADPMDGFKRAPSIESLQGDTWMIDAASTADLYTRSIGRRYALLATTLLYQRCLTWSCCLSYTDKQHIRRGSTNALVEGFSLTPSLRDPVFLQYVSEQEKGILSELERRFPLLATWQFLSWSQEAMDLIKNMGDFNNSRTFRQQTCRTKGFVTTPFDVKPTFDALSTPWQISATLSGRLSSGLPRRSARIKQDLLSRPWSRKVAVTVPTPGLEIEERSNTDIFIQKVQFHTLPLTLHS